MTIETMRGARPVPPVQAYRPHNITKKPSGLDWDALTPTCGLCGKRRGDVDLSRMLCQSCAEPVAAKPVKVTKPRPAKPKRVSGERKPRSDRRHVDEAEVVRRYLAAEPMADIAKTYGTSRKRVRTILTAHNVTIREPLRRTGRSGFTDSEKAAIVHAYEHHQALAKIAKDYRCSRVKIRAVLTGAGITLPGVRRSPNDYTDAMRRYAAGERVADIASAVGVSVTAIRSHAAKAGIVHGTRQPVDPKVMAVDYMGGLTLQEVARKHHVTKDRVSHLVREGGGTIRRKGKASR